MSETLDCNNFDKVYYLLLAFIICVYLHFLKYILKYKCCLDKKDNKEVKSAGSNDSLV